MKTPLNAFSLVEVVLALGVLSTAIAGLFGLLPLAFNQLHASMEATTQTQIIRSLASEIEMHDYSTLASGTSPLLSGSPLTSSTRYYDDEGLALSGNASVAAANYTAIISISGTTTSLLPGLANSTTTNLQFSNTSGTQLLVTIANRQKAVKKYCIWAVNNGR